MSDQHSKTSRLIPWVLIASLFASGTALAEQHFVRVVNNGFVPAQLTIAPGDTVTWTCSGNSNVTSCGIPHNVLSDDGSFAGSGAATMSVNYTETFNDEGTFAYHCSVHSFAGGSAMNGTITVEAAEQVFSINPGLNDAWFNQDTAGQGFFFNVFPDLELFFLSWFTYDTVRPDDTIQAILGEPGHRWVTAFGTWEGNKVTLDVELTTGGIFDSADPPVEQAAGYGTIMIVFHDCNNATLTYDFPSIAKSGVIELTRVTNDNIALCETLSEP